MKRIKKRQLKEDEFVSTLNKFLNFVKARTKEIIALGVAVCVLILFFIGLRYIKAQNLSKQSQVAGQIFNLGKDLDSNPQNLNKLESMTGKGKFSRLAFLVLATHFVEKGDFAKALAYLEKMPKSPKDILYFEAEDLRGQIFYQLKNYDKAIEIYKGIEALNPKEYSLDAVISHRAEALEAKGDTEAALALYKKLESDFAQTYYGYDASLKTKRLETRK